MNIYDYIALKKTWANLLLEAIESGDAQWWEETDFDSARDYLIAEGWDEKDGSIGDCVFFDCRAVPLTELKEFMDSSIYDTEKLLKSFFRHVRQWH